MMICKHCGNELRDDARFCPHCGASTSAPPAGGAPAVPAWEGPEGGSKKKTGLIVGIAAAALAVVALLVVALGGLFSSPKKQVEAAFVKSAAAYAAAEKKLGLPDMEQWQEDQKITQNMALALESVNSDLAGMDLSALHGLSLGLFTSYSGADRWMHANLWAAWGEDSLLDLSVKGDGAELYFNSPQLTGETHYGVNTETMGADLAARGVTEMEDVSFNLFDLVDMMLEKMDQEKLEEDFKAANKSLWEQAEVKKTGSKTMSINQTDTKTTAYRVTIPQEALYQYVDDLETMLSAVGGYDLYHELFQAMGMPREEIEDFLDELEDLDVYGELADGLREAVDEIGDLTLNVFLSGGYVSAVEYEGYLDNGRGDFLKLSLFLGGGEEYVDDLRLELKVDDQMFIVDSTGDHGLKSGVFTDETVIKGPFPMITSEMTLDPGRKEDNFQWKLSVSDSALSICVLDMAGDVYWSHDQLSLNPVTISVRVAGMEVCTLSLSYHVENHADKGTVEDPRLITQMDENELKQMVLDTQERALAWASEMENLFLTRLPQELLWSMMGVY